MWNAIRFEAHQPGAGRIGRNWVVRQNNCPEEAGAPVKRTVSFHCDNGIGDYEMNRRRRTDIQDALLNAFPMKNVLGQPYLFPGTTPNMFFILRVTPDQ